MCMCMVAKTMLETIFKEKARGKVSLIQFLVRGLAVAATICLLTDGSQAHVDRVEVLGNDVDTPPVQRFVINGDATHDEQWRMVKTRGNQFVVADRPFYVNGFNAYWLMILAVDPSTRGKVTEVFQQAAAVGLTVCRTWGFNDGGWRALQKSPSVYDENVFKALDFVVSEARKYKIRLIMSLVNNWDGYGGKAQYVKWARDAGLNLTSDDDFFSDQTVKGYFKNHVKNMLTRVNTYTNVMYKDDPTVFAWELMNELRCTSDPTGNKLQAWIQEMAFHVKSIDRDHLLEVGAEGFYGPSSPARLQTNPNTYAAQVGTDFISNHVPSPGHRLRLRPHLPGHLGVWRDRGHTAQIRAAVDGGAHRRRRGRARHAGGLHGVRGLHQGPERLQRDVEGLVRPGGVRGAPELDAARRRRSGGPALAGVLGRHREHGRRLRRRAVQSQGHCGDHVGTLQEATGFQFQVRMELPLGMQEGVGGYMVMTCSPAVSFHEL
ncbi:unnamed protein product [Urochloa humidicola]